MMVVASQEEKAPTASTLKQARGIITRLDGELRTMDGIRKRQAEAVQGLQGQVALLQAQLAIAHREKSSAIEGRDAVERLVATYHKRAREAEETVRAQKKIIEDEAVFHFDITDLQKRASEDAKTIARQAAQIEHLKTRNRLGRLSRFAYVA